MKTSKLTFAALLLLASAPLALGQGTYTQIDYPGATLTQCSGINAAGDISGYYQDSSGNAHGFLLSGGTYTTIDYPGAQFGTFLYGINDSGEVVGAAQLTESLGIGFSYDGQSQTFTEISYPGTDTVSTTPYSLNNAGTIVGVAQQDQGTSVFYVGFELNGGTYSKIMASGVPATIVTGINNLGEVVGYAAGPGKYSNFLFDQGKFQILKIAGYYPQAVGVNDSDAIVGGEAVTGGLFVGFLYQSGASQRLKFPGSYYTFPFAINNAGEIVGYFDVSGVIHGFTWTPPADAAKK